MHFVYVLIGSPACQPCLVIGKSDYIIPQSMIWYILLMCRLDKVLKLTVNLDVDLIVE